MKAMPVSLTPNPLPAGEGSFESRWRDFHVKLFSKLSGEAMHPLPVLPIGRYRARFASETPPRFSDFPGNAWRGALGHALKRAVCVTRQAACRDCLLYRSCLYPYFWDTPPHVGAEKMRKYETAPHPFVLETDDAAPLRLDFTLVGQANRHLPVFIHALTQAASGPRGVAGNTLDLLVVEQASPVEGPAWRQIHAPGTALEAQAVHAPATPPPPASCALEFLTPLRVKREGRHVGARDFTFADLFANLLRRISMLTYFHTETPLETDFRALKEAARQVEAKADLKWVEHTRYSQRQQAAMRLGGVVGRLTLEGTDLAPFWPYLWLGQFTHAGSGATMGLGRYRLISGIAAGPASLRAPASAAA
jgi:hypothetical protein